MQTIASASVRASVGFWSGWLAGTSLIAGGKLWCVITNSNMKVSELLGYIGKPVFRRQLAVGFAIFSITSMLFEQLGEKLNIERKPLWIKNIYTLSTTAVGITLGSLGAAAITHSAYHVVLYTVCIASVTSTLFHLKNLHSE